jgi:hypothetical protein
MKRTTTLIGAAILASASVSAFAQGFVTFSNIGAPITNLLTGMPVASGTIFRAALYFLPDQPTAPTSGDFDQRGRALYPATGTFLPGGIFNAGTRTAPDGNPAGSFGWFQVRAWEAAFGTSYEQAVANPQQQGGRLGLVGTSNIIRVGPLGGGSISTPSLVGAGLKGFFVGVPEPSIIGLGVLGIGALLLLCRRR